MHKLYLNFSTEKDCPYYPYNCTTSIKGENCEHICNTYNKWHDVMEINRKSGVFENLIFSKDELCTELMNLNTITLRLDYWLKFHSEYYDRPLAKSPSNWNEIDYVLKEIFRILFGNKCILLTALFIPTDIYNEYYAPFSETPEYSFWFLKYLANNWFKTHLKYLKFDVKLKTSLAKEFIEAELKQINDLERNAKKLLLLKEIDIFLSYFINSNNKELEYLRIEAGYYENNYLDGVHSIGNLTVESYAKHKLFKPYLLEKLHEITDNKNENTEDAFINFLVKGIKELSDSKCKEKCWANLEKNSSKNESEWRDWFCEYFQRFRDEFPVSLNETEIGNGKIDLRITNNKGIDHKIEFSLEFPM